MQSRRSFSLSFSLGMSNCLMSIESGSGWRTRDGPVKQRCHDLCVYINQEVRTEKDITICMPTGGESKEE